MLRLFVSATSFLMLCFLPIFCTLAAEQIKQGEAIERNLTAKETLSFPLAAEPGDYVKGSLQGEQLVLQLVDQAGQPVRRLADGKMTQQEFQFVLGDKSPYSLVVHSAQKTQLRLQLSEVIPAALQKKPAELLQSPRLRTLHKELTQGKTTASFWDERTQQGTPLVEEQDVLPPLAKGTVLVTFLWRGAQRNAKLFGAPSGDHDEMNRLGDSDVWYCSYRVPRTARIDYRIAPDVPELNADPWTRRRALLATVQRDPLNPHAFPNNPCDIYEGFSVLELLDAPPAPWLEERSGTPTGTLATHSFSSKILGNQRSITIYRPQGFQPEAAENGLLIVFDGAEYLEEMQTPLLLDHLIAEGKIRSTAAVFITNPSSQARAKELPPNSEFSQFLAEELLPWIAEQKLKTPATQTVICGASYGGLAAAYAGLMHPELFGNVLSQSGSFWWSPGARPGQKNDDQGWLIRQFVHAPRSSVHFYLEAGTFEIPSDILATNRHLRDVLQAKGQQVTYQEFVGGHGYFYWKYSLSNGLQALLKP